MKKCIAYRALACHGGQELSRSRWVPCGFAAADGSDFCKKHSDAVIGGVLGLWTAGLLEPDAAKNLKMDGKLSQKKKGACRRKLSLNGSQT
jgi:hypothetical protein